MMLQRLLLLFIGVLLLVCCQPNRPDIRALCQRDEIGNYIIKWETDPPMEGIMKLYVSSNPERFNKSRSVGYSNINDNVTTYITSDNMSRQYFLLSFNDKYSEIVGARDVTMNNVLNLRDLGGYPGDSDKKTAWGKIYRSGALSLVSEWDSIRLDKLGIKTIIDLRTEKEVWMEPTRYSNAHIVNAPIGMGNFDDIMRRILDGRVRKGDGILFMQDMYLQFITHNKESLTEALEVFLDRDNYPILFNCTFGKDRVGFFAALILSALDVPEDVIIRDYLLSNDYKWRFYGLESIETLARTLTPDAQETMTAMLSTDENLLELAFRKIKKDYGTVDKYLSKELNFTDKKRDQLKEIMLF